MSNSKPKKRAGVRGGGSATTGSTAARKRVTRKTQSDRPTLKDAKLLRKAADEILIRGWAYGERHTFDGRVCALGALENAVGGGEYIENSRPSLVRALVASLTPEAGGGSFSVAEWSNHVAKSAENVAAGMIRAALKLEGR